MQVGKEIEAIETQFEDARVTLLRLLSQQLKDGVVTVEAAINMMDPMTEAMLAYGDPSSLESKLAYMARGDGDDKTNALILLIDGCVGCEEEASAPVLESKTATRQEDDGIARLNGIIKKIEGRLEALKLWMIEMEKTKAGAKETPGEAKRGD